MIRTLLLLFISFSLSAASFGMENAFYILHTHAKLKSEVEKQSFSSLSSHYKAINLLISQAYRIRKDGTVAGFVDADVIQFARDHNMKLMALVTNAGFDHEGAHLFLANHSAQKKAIQTILTHCEKNHFDGVQFDFEGVSWKDKSALTQFYISAYNSLHQRGLIVSFAVVPLTNDGKQPSDFLQRKYEHWGGAYNLKVLGEHSDFITLMAYDQHTRGTTPGPTANGKWVEAVIRYALRFIPANKISLGVPTYSGYWYIRNKENGHITVKLDDISYKQAQQLLEKFRVKLHWDNNSKINYAFFEHDWLNEYLFVENHQSFEAKLALANKYHLRGVSVFNLGNEIKLRCI